ncbi:Auxin efflux carrier [Vigna unguiculata]|uniref:Auxin efflux carrier n=1 Tax=Vigna unguiculata TaxID=3917 RepID=A0A4D6L128_VIGUN|nr:Auxin efflux carrier [Vigna unguiculata]
MGFLQLLSVASFPVIKVLLVTAVGLFLALDDISILGEDTKKRVNQLVFYVFNPSLVATNLAKTITLKSVVQLWFMPFNVLITFILGSALGWILIKITRPPQHLEGLILGCCSAGNLGNLPIIIIPAMCRESGSPFGDSDVCYQYGMAYASLSMAIGTVYMWSYVYNIIRISASRIQKEDASSNDIVILKASGEASESHPQHFFQTLNPTKDTMDDAYTLLLPEEESEEKTTVVLYYLVNLLFVFLLLQIIGFVIGIISPVRNLIIGSGAPLHVVEESTSMLGEAAIPILTLVMGANLLKGLKESSTPLWTLVGIVTVRYIFLPLLGVAAVKAAIHLSLVPSDPLYQFVLLLQHALPPAMNIGTMVELFGAGESECSVIMLWTYAFASIAVTLWSTFFMWLVS